MIMPTKDSDVAAQLVSDWETGEGRPSGAAKGFEEAYEGHCQVCRVQMIIQPAEPPICGKCNNALGPHLAKALCDPFDYAIGLKSGEVIRCSEVNMHGEWVVLNQVNSEETSLKYPCPRGLQVHMSAVAWIADAPEGS